MDYVLYAIWLLVPAGFFLLSLWSWLEQSTVVRKGKKRTEEPRDLLKQALFLTVCSIITFLLDYLIIQPGFVDFLFTDWTPKSMMRLFLYPAVLYLGAVLGGGTKRPSIEKLPRPSEQYRKR